MIDTYEAIRNKICETKEDADKDENSKFSLVVGTAIRARQIIDEDVAKERELNNKIKEDNKSKKLVSKVNSEYKRVLHPLSQAIDELVDGKYKIVSDNKK